MMRCIWKTFIALSTIVACAQGAQAAGRVALIIGNSAYQNVAPLANPANDADAVAAMFKAASFDEIASHRDLRAAEMRRVLRDFADKSRAADIAVIYYAGHGIEIDGANYLIPVDAVLERDTDVLDEAFSLDRVLVAVETARRLRLVILDACRDNPFAKTMRRSVGSRAIGRGLAKVEPASPNTLIAYASKAGSTASDGDSNNSPFAAALVKHIATPGLDLRRAFGFVRDDVLKSTGNRQEPYVYGSLGGEDMPLVPVKANAPLPDAKGPADVRRDYEFASHIGTRDAWSAFLAQYSQGFYASLAKAQLSKIAAEEARVAATEKARVASEEKERLAVEGAKNAVQAKAASEARTAEIARLAAETNKQIETAKLATAEQRLGVADIAPEVPGRSQPEPQQVAALLDVPLQKETLELPKKEMNRLLQSELGRVGCFNGRPDGEWNEASRRSMALFNRSAGTRFDVKLASASALDAIKAMPARACPLVCDHGYRNESEACVRIACGAGSFINDANECVRRKVKATANARRQVDTPKRAKPGGRKCFVAAGQSYCE